MKPKRMSKRIKTDARKKTWKSSSGGRLAPFGRPEYLDLPPCGIGQAAWLARQLWLPRAGHGRASLANSGFWARSCSWLAITWQPSNGSAYLAWPDWAGPSALAWLGQPSSQKRWKSQARNIKGTGSSKSGPIEKILRPDAVDPK